MWLHRSADSPVWPLLIRKPHEEEEGRPRPDGVGMVPVERIELPTFGLQNRCSTAELNRRIEATGEG